MSQAQKERFKDPEQKKWLQKLNSSYRPFDVFKKDGTYVKSFDYQYEAQEYLKKTYNIKGRIRMDNVLKGKIKTAFGFIFKYQVQFWV